ncbi:MAG: thioredoxin family protein [Bacillota bacterium]
MTLQKLNPKNFEEIIYDNEENCLVVFSRKSCHVCQDVVPLLEELKPKYQGKISFYYVDVEEQQSLFERFSLKGVPQILFFKDGEYQGKMAGKVEDEQIEEKIMEMLE